MYVLYNDEIMMIITSVILNIYLFFYCENTKILSPSYIMLTKFALLYNRKNDDSIEWLLGHYHRVT